MNAYKRNTFKNCFRRGGTFEGPPLQPAQPGKQVMGLISVKNVSWENEWGQHDGVQFFFLGKDGQSSATYRVSGAYGPNSNLAALLDNMTNGKFNIDRATDDNVFELVNRQVDKWFEVMVEQRSWNAKETGEKVTRSYVKKGLVFPVDYDEGPDLPPKAWMARLREDWANQGAKRTAAAQETIAAPTVPVLVDVPETIDEDDIPF